MRYIQALVTRTRQTDKIPMNLMLDALNHTLASVYGIEFESELPTYLCDCNYSSFKTSSFHKRFNPCNRCLIIDLDKTISRTFRYTNKSEVRVKEPIIETETVFVFYPVQEPQAEINSLDKIIRGFIGEDLEGRALPKELIAEFKKDQDWDEFYSDEFYSDDDSSWNSYDGDYAADYNDYDGGNSDNEDYGNIMADNHTVEACADGDCSKGHGSQKKSDHEFEIKSYNTASNSESAVENSSGDKEYNEPKEYDFQILQQIQSKKYILEVDQRIIITNVDAIDLDKVPTNVAIEPEGKLQLIQRLLDFIRCGWCRINILRNSGDGDKELVLIANQLRLMCEAYRNILSLLEESEKAAEELSNGYNYELDLITAELERELMPVLKKFVILGKDKEVILIAKNWLPILKELFPDDLEQGVEDIEDTPEFEKQDSENGNAKEANLGGYRLVADVLAVLGVLEFRRRQDGWAAQHLTQSLKLVFQNVKSYGETFNVFKYLSDPSESPSSTPWLLKEAEALRISELLSDWAKEFLNGKQQWLLYESVLSYLKQNKSDLNQKEIKRLVSLSTNLTKKMLKESRSLIEEDVEFYVPKVAQLLYDQISYYYSKGQWENMYEYMDQAEDLLDLHPEFLPLSLKADLLALSIKTRIYNGYEPIDELKDLIENCLTLYRLTHNIDALEKVAQAFLERINLNIIYIKELLPFNEEKEDCDIEEEGEQFWDEEINWNHDKHDGSDEGENPLKDLFSKGNEWKDLFDDEDENPLKDLFDDEDEWKDQFDDDQSDSDSDYEIECQSKINKLKEEIDKDFVEIQSLIDDFKNNYLEAQSQEGPDSPIFDRKLQLLEIRIDCVHVKYLTLHKETHNDEHAYQIYQSLVAKIAQILEDHYDKELYQLYRKVTRDSAVLCFRLEKFNDIKKGYKQLISYQKTLISKMPQKGRAFQEANLDLAQTNCYLGSYYWDLKTYDHALKYAQIAQKLVDDNSDLKFEKDVNFKMEVYSLLHLVAKDSGRDDVDSVAKKEWDRLDKIMRTKFHRH